MPAIEMTRKDLRVLQLRAAAARAADAKQARRLLAIAMGLDGPSRRLAAAGRWHRPADAARLYASLQHGWGGGARRPAPAWARRPRLAEAQRSEVAKRVEDGPDRKTDGWRGALALGRLG
jgi:hypothetical protein